MTTEDGCLEALREAAKRLGVPPTEAHNEIKRERGCSRCGVDTVACLDFHHLETTTKEMAVGKMAPIADEENNEVEKCIVLCANCHRIEHSDIPS